MSTSVASGESDEQSKQAANLALSSASAPSSRLSQSADSSPYGIDVLAFGPHPDDVEMFCGGSLIRFAQLGYSTAVIDLTRGERATRGTPEQREIEARAAAEVMGLSFRENLGFPDTGIESGGGADSLNPGSQLSVVVAALRRHRPELVLIPWHEERHPDHVAASHLLTRAVFYAGVGGFPSEPPLERHLPRQVLYYAMRYRMTPSFVLDTSQAALKKREAMLCYQSQLAPLAPVGSTTQHRGGAGSSSGSETRGALSGLPSEELSGADSESGAQYRAGSGALSGSGTGAPFGAETHRAPRTPPSPEAPSSPATPSTPDPAGPGENSGSESAGWSSLPPPLVGSPRALEAIDARDRYYGSMIGVSHGEAFRMANVPGLADPLRHFRDNPYFEAHAFESFR